MLYERGCKKSEAKRAKYAILRNNCIYKLFGVGFDSLLLFLLLGDNMLRKVQRKRSVDSYLICGRNTCEPNFFTLFFAAIILGDV